jgi:acyl carrier protein
VDKFFLQLKILITRKDETKMTPIFSDELYGELAKNLRNRILPLDIDPGRLSLFLLTIRWWKYLTAAKEKDGLTPIDGSIKIPVVVQNTKKVSMDHLLNNNLICSYSFYEKFKETGINTDFFFISFLHTRLSWADREVEFLFNEKNLDEIEISSTQDCILSSEIPDDLPVYDDLFKYVIYNDWPVQFGIKSSLGKMPRVIDPVKFPNANYALVLYSLLIILEGLGSYLVYEPIMVIEATDSIDVPPELVGLGIDSLDKLQIVLGLQQNFDDELENLNTIHEQKDGYINSHFSKLAENRYKKMQQIKTFLESMQYFYFYFDEIRLDQHIATTKELLGALDPMDQAKIMEDLKKLNLIGENDGLEELNQKIDMIGEQVRVYIPEIVQVIEIVKQNFDNSKQTLLEIIGHSVLKRSEEVSKSRFGEIIPHHENSYQYHPGD